MERQPTVSVILPGLEGRPLQPALDSVLAQTFPSFEVIVIRQRGEQVTSADARVRFIEAAEGNLSDIWNSGIAAARAPLIAFIKPPDVWMPRRLELQLPLLQDSRVGFVYSNARILDSRPVSQLLTFFDLHPPARGAIASHLALRNTIPTSSILARRDLVRQCNGFSPVSAAWADDALVLRLARRAGADFVMEPLIEYQLRDADVDASGLVESLEDRIRLYAAELAAEGECEELQFALFHLTVRYRWACLRWGRSPARDATRLSKAALADVGLLNRLRWGWKAAFDEGRVRLRRRRSGYANLRPPGPETHRR